LVCQPDGRGVGVFVAVLVGTRVAVLVGCWVAVKVLDPALLAAGGERDFLAKFAEEAALVARLDHPNILGAHDYGEAGGTAYLVTPYVPGGTLHDRLRREGRFPAPGSATRWRLGGGEVRAREGAGA
jgi:serine/threonine protein kinase